MDCAPKLRKNQKRERLSKKGEKEEFHPSPFPQDGSKNCSFFKEMNREIAQGGKKGKEASKDPNPNLIFTYWSFFFIFFIFSFFHSFYFLCFPLFSIFLHFIVLHCSSEASLLCLSGPRQCPHVQRVADRAILLQVRACIWAAKLAMLSKLATARCTFIMCIVSRLLSNIGSAKMLVALHECPSCCLCQSRAQPSSLDGDITSRHRPQWAPEHWCWWPRPGSPVGARLG